MIESAAERIRWPETERSDPRRALQYFLCEWSGPLRKREIELLLPGPFNRVGRSGQRKAQGAQNAKAALDPIRPVGRRNDNQTAAGVMSFVSFHGAILKQGVGHGLSDAKRFWNYFLL
jgi:hypothetical protein